MLFKKARIQLLISITLLALLLSACKVPGLSSGETDAPLPEEPVAPSATEVVEPSPEEPAAPSATEVVAPSPELSAEEASATEEAASAVASPEESMASSSTIEQILARGHIKVGVSEDLKPFGYLENGEEAGFDVDLAREFARRWLKDEKAVEFVQLTSAERIPLLAAGEVDLVAASMTHKKERDETIDFSQTYFLDGQSLLVQNDSAINGLADLDGKKVAALQGTTGIEQIQEKADEVGITIQIEPFLEHLEALEALIARQVDALTTDSVALSQFAQDNPGLSVVGERFTQEPYAIGVPQGDSSFRELVNFTLQEMKLDGSYDSIYQKWFPDDDPYPIAILPGDADYLPLPYKLAAADEEAETEPITETLEIDDLLTNGVLIAGVPNNFPPFSYLDENDNRVGFEIDIAREFAKRWLGDENAVELNPVRGEQRFVSLEQAQTHLTIAVMTATFERCQRVGCSQTYFEDGARLLVHPDAGINSICDLDGQYVAAGGGTTGVFNIENEAPRWCEYTVPPTVKKYGKQEDGFDAVKTGIVAAYTTDGIALSKLALQNPPLIVVGDPFSSEPYSIAVAKQNQELLDLINFTLQEMKRDGTYDALSVRWFGCERTPFPIITDKGTPSAKIQELIGSDSPLAPDTSCNPTPESYVVQPGDTLFGLSVRFYGSGTLYQCIHDANRETIGDDPRKLQPEMSLRIPDQAECSS